jgi:hypothetical protein
MLTQVDDKKSPVHPPEDDRKFWEAYDALTDIINDYSNFDITFEITLTPRNDLRGTAEDILKAVARNYYRTTGTFDIEKATQVLQGTRDLLLKPFSLHAQQKVYQLANSLKTRPSPERLLGGLLIGLLGAALVITGLLILCTPAAATLPAVDVVMNIGYAAQYISAAVSLSVGAGCSYLGFGIFKQGLRRGLSKNMHELGNLVNEERATHLIYRHVFGRNDLTLEDTEVYYSRNTR